MSIAEEYEEISKELIKIKKEEKNERVVLTIAFLLFLSCVVALIVYFLLIITGLI